MHLPNSDVVGKLWSPGDCVHHSLAVAYPGFRFGGINLTKF